MSVMTDDQNASESAKHADSQSLRALCQACREPIQPGAKICPHCASPQARRRWWHTTSVVLKWVGATSAILSLLALSIQLGEIFQDSRKTRTSVRQLVQAADRLADNNDLSGAMEMLDEALLLDPGDPDTRKLQVKVAMRQIQQYVHPVDRRDWELKPLIADNMGDRGKSKRQKLKSLIPKIRRGIGHQNPRTAADVLAHLGWAYRLGRTPYATVFNLFEDAFSYMDYIDETIIRALGLKTGVMGIEVEPDKKGDAVSFGATLKRVMDNGPAERAGLKQGDKIVAVGDVRVRTGYAMLDYLETFLPGNKIMLTILRQNSEKQIEVILGPGGDPKKFGLNLYKIVNRHFYECVDIDTGYGLLHVVELNQEFRSAYNLGNDIEGVIVLEEHASGIQTCRLTSGDVISEANSRKIRTPEDLKKVFRAAVDDGVEWIPIVISEAKGVRKRSFFVR